MVDSALLADWKHAVHNGHTTLGFDIWAKQVNSPPEAIQEAGALLHDIQCRLSHTDQCSWDYESNNWATVTHRKYAARAQTLLRLCVDARITEDDVIFVLRRFKELR